MNIRVSYFAAVAAHTGCRENYRDTEAATAGRLYAEIAAAHRFPWPADRITLAVNDHIVSAEHPLRDGDHLMLLPPVSGG